MGRKLARFYLQRRARWGKRGCGLPPGIQPFSRRAGTLLRPDFPDGGDSASRKTDPADFKSGGPRYPADAIRFRPVLKCRNSRERASRSYRPRPKWPCHHTAKVQRVPSLTSREVQTQPAGPATRSAAGLNNQTDNTRDITSGQIASRADHRHGQPGSVN
jgi:hypothetical protein